jgi:N-acyl-D-aspartate/D-glutamate deacylase
MPAPGHQSTDRIGPMLAHPLVHIGASDGGAHLSSFSTYGDTGYLFSEFVRKAGAMSLEQAVGQDHRRGPPTSGA